MARPTFLVNGPALVSARKDRGFSTRAALLKHLKLAGKEVSSDALDDCEKSPNQPHRALHITLAILSEFLDVPLSSIVITDDDINGQPVRQRDCSGTWSVEGGDIVIPNHFDYPHGAKPWAAKINIKVIGTGVVAEGRDHHGDLVRLRGWLEEGGDHLVGTYEILNSRKRIYGTVNLQYLACGEKMKGWYLGRETGQGVVYILGRLELTLEHESQG